MRITTSLLLLFSLSFCYGQNSYSLESAIDYALQNANEIKMSNINIMDAEGQIDEYKSIGMPKVSAEMTYNYYLLRPQTVLQDFISPAVYGILDGLDQLPDGFVVPEPQSQKVSFATRNNLNIGVNGSWLLFDGSYLTGLKAARLYRDLVIKEKDLSEQNVRTKITQAYLGVLIAVENLRLIYKNLENAEKARFEINAFYENGLVEKLDVDRAELSVENLKTQREGINFSIAMAKDLLKFQMVYPMEEDIVLTEDLESLLNQIQIEDINLNEEVNYSNRAEYANIQLGQELNQLNLERTQKQKLPTLRAIAGISETLQRDKLFSGSEAGFLPTAVVGLALNYNIYDGGNRTATEQRLQLAIEKTEVQKREFEQGMVLQVRMAKNKVLNAKKAVENAKKTMRISQDIYDKTQIKYKEGVGSSLEVSQAESNLYGAESYYIQSIYELVTAYTELSIANGEL